MKKNLPQIQVRLTSFLVSLQNQCESSKDLHVNMSAHLQLIEIREAFLTYYLCCSFSLMHTYQQFGHTCAQSRVWTQHTNLYFEDVIRIDRCVASSWLISYFSINSPRRSSTSRNSTAGCQLHTMSCAACCSLPTHRYATHFKLRDGESQQKK